MASTGPSSTSQGTESTTSPTSSTTASTTVDPTGTEATGQPPDTDDTTTSSETEGADCEGSADCSGDLLCIDGSCEPCSAAEAPDDVCAAADAGLPYCDTQTEACVACTADQGCSGSTPFCDTEAACVACNEHSQCPDSACHLGGPDEGGCFDEADVVEVQSPGAFPDLLAAIGPGEQRVLRLGAATYRFPLEFQADIYSVTGAREVALIGNGSSVLEGAAATGSIFDPDATPGLLYIRGVAFAPIDDFFLVSGAGPDAELWLDDSTFPGAIQVRGEAHVRRSSLPQSPVTPLGSQGIWLTADGSLFIENSAIGPSPYTDLIFEGAIDIRYSTLILAGGVQCDGATGTIRNSIVLGGANPAVETACDGMTWFRNAVNQAGFGTQVPDFNASWFNNSPSVRFRLSDTGEGVFADIAQWEAGDPPLDAEGDPRPTAGPGFPGMDEP